MESSLAAVDGASTGRGLPEASPSRPVLDLGLPSLWEVGVSPSSELRGAGESGTHVMESAHLQGDLKEKQLEE